MGQGQLLVSCVRIVPEVTVAVLIFSILYSFTIWSLKWFVVHFAKEGAEKAPLALSQCPSLTKLLLAYKCGLHHLYIALSLTAQLKRILSSFLVFELGPLFGLSQAISTIKSSPILPTGLSKEVRSLTFEPS